jgi:hypothetical protein
MNKSILDNSNSNVKIFRLDGKLHREDGPAIEWKDGRIEWFLFGKLHRVDGPAVISSDGEYKGWFLNGYVYSKEEWFSKLTPEQQYNYLWNMNE